VIIKVNRDTAIVNGVLESRKELLERKRKEKEQEQQVGPGVRRRALVALEWH
jgi:hypothetical protein